MSSDFRPAHPAFWAGQWRKTRSSPTFENYTYVYQSPYWSSNYFYKQTQPARWGSNYRGLWSRYYRTWDWDLARNPLS